MRSGELCPIHRDGVRASSARQLRRCTDELPRATFLRMKKMPGSLTPWPHRIERKKREDRVVREGYFRHGHRPGPLSNGGNQTEDGRNGLEKKS
jgi:hypothetical protein